MTAPAIRRPVPYALGCPSRKRMYASRPDAELVAQWLRRRHETRDHAYRCKRCGKSHVGEWGG